MPATKSSPQSLTPIGKKKAPKKGKAMSPKKSKTSSKKTSSKKTSRKKKTSSKKKKTSSKKKKTPSKKKKTSSKKKKTSSKKKKTSSKKKKTSRKKPRTLTGPQTIYDVGTRKHITVQEGEYKVVTKITESKTNSKDRRQISYLKGTNPATGKKFCSIVKNERL